jgi:hypothetical protein
LSVSTGNRRCGLPKVEFQIFRKIANLGQKLTAFAAIFDGTTELHAALIFLLATGFDSAVAFFVRQGHFESPKASTGASR